MGYIGNNGRCVHRRIFDLTLNVLLLVCQEIVSIPGSADIVLAHKAVQGFPRLFPESNLVPTDIVSHENDDVIHICRNVIHISDQIQKLQHIHVLSLHPQPIVRGLLTPLDHTADRTVQKSMYRVIEPEKWNQRILILFLDLLRRLLKTGQHGPLPAGQMFA